MWHLKNTTACWYSVSDPVDTVLSRLLKKGKENWDHWDSTEYAICVDRAKERVLKLDAKEVWTEPDLIEYYICKRAMEVIA